ncbi:CGNR zinc finger domain-containing protein [Zhihengliuella flava]|uniref:RNA-binding Zn ribbon-like protein n=1 Tax=Zhihengliuella flava TaxID=1285193 RepID=A0A931GFF8_9MICC|nr:CGNR zinc finger domain-containing protein [Zhihengliuella flava]MBG6084617.1 putative RNA-binding Zn ribbon-like protein [Zhihengliuella flava]
MQFAPDTLVALRSAVNLLNTGQAPVDQLTTIADLEQFLDQEQYSGFRAGTEGELRQVRHLRSTFRAFWDSAEDEAVELVNQTLRNVRALPQLVKHDGWDYHLHATPENAPLVDRMAAEIALAVMDVIRAGELDRLRVCAAEDCHAVLVDTSRNRSKRFCDTGNCANRSHVRAYRQRQSAR